MNETPKGVIQGLLSGMFWGFGTSLNAFILTLIPFVGRDSQLSSVLLLAFLHDFFSATLLIVGFLLRGEKHLFLSILNSRSLYFVIVSALFAGPIGMVAYLFAVDSLGSGLAATISAFYPAVAAILGAVFLKDHLTKKGWWGLSLIMLAVMVLGYSHFSLLNSLFFGLAAAFICVGGWASESVITAYGMKDDLLPKQALLIRQCSSSVAYLVLMSLEIDVYYDLLTVFSSQIIVIVAFWAVIGTLSYLCYYSAINKIGPVKATGMNVTYSIWTVIFSFFIFGGNLDIKLVICGVMIIIGTLFVVKN